MNKKIINAVLFSFMLLANLVEATMHRVPISYKKIEQKHQKTGQKYPNLLALVKVYPKMFKRTLWYAKKYDMYIRVNKDLSIQVIQNFFGKHVQYRNAFAHLYSHLPVKTSGFPFITGFYWGLNQLRPWHFKKVHTTRIKELEDYTKPQTAADFNTLLKMFKRDLQSHHPNLPSDIPWSTYTVPEDVTDPETYFILNVNALLYAINDCNTALYYMDSEGINHTIQYGCQLDATYTSLLPYKDHQHMLDGKPVIHINAMRKLMIDIYNIREHPLLYQVEPVLDLVSKGTKTSQLDVDIDVGTFKPSIVSRHLAEYGSSIERLPRIGYLRLQKFLSFDSMRQMHRYYDELLENFDAADALVIDVRFNELSQDMSAIALAERLIPWDKHYHQNFINYYRAQVYKKGHPDYGRTFKIKRTYHKHYDKPVVVLVSQGTVGAGTEFALALKRLAPHVAFVGRPTSNASYASNLYVRQLPSTQKIMYHLSHEKYIAKNEDWSRFKSLVPTGENYIAAEQEPPELFFTGESPSFQRALDILQCKLQQRYGKL